MVGECGVVVGYPDNIVIVVVGETSDVIYCTD